MAPFDNDNQPRPWGADDWKLCALAMAYALAAAIAGIVLR